MKRLKGQIDILFVVVTVVVSVLLMSGGVLMSSRVSADGTSSANAAVTVPFACTMSGTGNNSHNATITPNTYSGASGSEYQNGIGKTTLTAICNDDNGFSIYAIGYTGNSYDSENHTKLVGSTTGGTIATKAYASGDTTSNWSMKLTKVTNTSESYNPQNLTLTTGYDAWHAVPDTYTKVAEYHANTGSSATDTTLGVKLETTYAAFIAANQPADTYTGQVKYTMVHPYSEQPLQPQSTEPGKICYYANVSDAIGTMGCQTIPETDETDGVSSTSATLLASNYSRQNYGFAGWSNQFDYATNSEAKFYGPQETIEYEEGQYSGTNKGLSLYAVWVKSQGSIQDQSKVASVCNSLITAPTDGTANLTSVSALTDQRDNETYAIAKLADGKCWMIENLRLESTAEHNSDGSLAQAYATNPTYGDFQGLAGAEPAWANNSTTANGLYSTNGAGNTVNIGTTYAGYRFPRYNNINTPVDVSDRPQEPTSNSTVNNTSNAGMYSYGNYYTWAAAIADTNRYTSGEHDTTSICPKGWKLPLGTASTGDLDQGAADAANYVGGFSYLDRKMGGTGQSQSTASDSLRWRKYPNNYLYSGDVGNSSINNRGSSGFYWSTIARSILFSGLLSIDQSSLSPGIANNYKYTGRTIRCIVNS